MIDIHINNESSILHSVVLGIPDSLGGTPRLEQAYDARSKESIRMDIYPLEKDLIREMNGFLEVLEKHQIQVFRPDLLSNTNQVYARDIGFVIGDKFVVPNIISDREHEKEGIVSILDQIPPNQIVRMPTGARAEGGDVIVWKNHLFVGYSEKEDFDAYYVSRTNVAGLEFLKNSFPEYEVHGFELVKNDEEPRESALHLDCCFQPIGEKQCIICQDGFKNITDFDFLIEFFGKENCITITSDEMYDMNTNVFSISPEIVVTELNFIRLNEELEKRGFQLEKLAYSEVRKMGGLFRCSTLPLNRS